MTLSSDLKRGFTIATCVCVAGGHPLHAIAAMPPLGLARAMVRQPAIDLSKVAADESAQKKEHKVTGALLLKRSRRAMTYVSESAIRLSPKSDAKFAPFLRATVAAAKSMQSLDDAFAKHDSKAFAQAISQSSMAIGRLNETHRFAALSDKPLEDGIRTLNVAWRLFAKSSSRGLGDATAEQRLANGRRIAALQHRLTDLKAKRAQNAEEVKQIDYMIQDLDRAARANEKHGDEWLALNTVNMVVGRFGGYYDGLVVTDPTTAAAYRADYAYCESVDRDFTTYSFSYYQETSWASYTESYEVRQNTRLNVSVTESATIDQEMTATVTEAESLSEASDENKALAEAEDTAASEATADDPGDHPDAATDAETEKGEAANGSEEHAAGESGNAEEASAEEADGDDDGGAEAGSSDEDESDDGGDDGGDDDSE